MEAENDSLTTLLSSLRLSYGQHQAGDMASTARSDARDRPMPSPSGAQHKLLGDIQVLIQIAISDTDDTGLETERLLDGMSSVIKRQVRSKDASESWLSDVIKVVTKLVWIHPWQPKAHKKLVKVMMELERHGPLMVRAELSRHTPVLRDTTACRDVLNTWHNLIEVSVVARALVAEQLPHLVVVLNTKFGWLLAESEAWTVERQHWLHLLIKMALQLFQHIPHQVSLLVWGPIQDEATIHQLQQLASTLLAIIATKGMPIHCLPLAGTAVAFLIGLAPTEIEGATIYVHVLTSLGSDKEVIIGNLKIYGKSLPAVTSQGQAEDQIRPHGAKPCRTFGHLSLLNGLLPCAKPRLLWQPVSDSQSEADFMVTWLFCVISDLCEVPEHQHHSFHLLTIWYQRVSKCFPQLHPEIKTSLFGKNSPLVSKTLNFVWTHLESPVEGINESIMEVFRTMVKLHLEEAHMDSKKAFDNVECEKIHQDDTIYGKDSSKTYPTGKSLSLMMSDSVETFMDLSKASGSVECEKVLETSPLISEVLQQVLQLSWQIKGKHCLLATLLPHVNIFKFLEEQRDALPQLLQCLSANHLVPSATSLYRTFLQELCPDPHRETSWDREGFTAHCLPLLVTGLTNPHSLLRQNTGHHWLPVTLKYAPWTYVVLVDQLLTRVHQSENQKMNVEPGRNLHALVSVLKAGRALELVDDLPTDIIRDALRHQDDDLRLDAFSVLCEVQKKSESLTPTELHLLKDWLPYNMTNDSAPFRQRLQASLRSALVRLRHSVLASMKLNMGDPHQRDPPASVRDALEFLDWLWNLTMDSLCPGSSYQRLKTALDWATIVLDVFTYQPERRQRKGITPDTVVHLMTVAQSLSRCHFYTSRSSHLLLTSLLHGTDEIRDMAAALLLQFFPWPLPLEGVSDDLDIGGHQLLQTGLRLCNSAKSHESESGALLSSMIFHRLVLERGEAYEVNFMDGQFIVKPVVSFDRNSGTDAATRHFISQMVGLVGSSVAIAKSDTRKAAQQAPAHGLLLTIRKCLSDKSIKFELHDQWQPIIEKVTEVTSQLIDLVLAVLGGRVHSDETAPSFEQMSVAIAETLAESGGGSEVTPAEMLTSGHQLMMTWCWVNIKECSILLGALVEHLPITSVDQSGVLTMDHVTAIGDVFLKVLTRCRHRGAIEGCNMGLVRYCSQLLLSSDPLLHALPGLLLDKVLAQVTQADKALSVTRRSAGLPLIVTSIITSESKTRQDVLLTHVVSSLLGVISAPVSQTDQQVDMPQVHAMNILKAVMKESSVAMAVMRHVAPIVMAAVEGFASPHWAIRNAATQLFGTLVTRMFGQKKSRESLVKMMTVPEFFAHYPSLEWFLLQHIEGGAADQRAGPGGGLRLRPCVFPVLSILARLGAASHSHNMNSVQAFFDGISQLLGNAVCAVRELASQAVVALVPRISHVKYLCDVIASLPTSHPAAMVTGYNRVHGNLLLCHSLLATIGCSNHGNDVYDAVLLELSTKHWLASTGNPCHCVRSKYLNVILKVITKSTMDLPGEISKNLSEQMVKLQDGSDVVQVGRDQLVHPLVSWYLSRTVSGRSEHIGGCLRSGDTDLTIACLQELESCLCRDDIGMDFWKTTQLELFNLVLGLPHCTVLGEALQCILDIHAKTGACDTGNQVLALWMCLMALFKRKPNSHPAGLAVRVMAVLLNHHMDQALRDCIVGWAALLPVCCDPHMAEWLHLQTALALHTLAPYLVANLNQSPQSEDVTILAVRMFEAGLRLLVNEQSYIRCHAADFVACLHSRAMSHDQSPPLHTTLALEILCETFGDLLSGSDRFLTTALGTMWKAGSLLQLVESVTKPHIEELFEQEDGNYYKENVHLASLVGTQLVRHVSSKVVEENLMVLDSVLRVITQDLKDARPRIHQNCTVSGQLNVTCRVHVYEALWRRLQVATTILTLTQRVGVLPPGGKTFYLVIEDYLQSPWLHPHIRGLMLSLLDLQKSFKASV